MGCGRYVKAAEAGLDAAVVRALLGGGSGLGVGWDRSGEWV
jgi:hypothetical protein